MPPGPGGIVWLVTANPCILIADLVSSDYHLLGSIGQEIIKHGQALLEQHFNSHENYKKWPDDWFAPKSGQFGIYKLPERWKKFVASLRDNSED